MSDKDVIRLGGRLTLGAVEKTLSESYSWSRQQKRITFDLSSLTWVGYFPGVLLFSWIAQLKSIVNQTEVTVSIPRREALSPTVRKLLLDFGFLERIKELGVEVPYHSSPPPYRSIPLRVITRPESDNRTHPPQSFNLNEYVSLEELPFGVTRDALEIVLRELAENSFIHGEGRVPHFGVFYSESDTGSPSRRGLVSTHEGYSQYIEIAFGDLGPGINACLDKAMPRDYHPAFVESRKPKLLKDERVLAYGFEFSSTSDEEARRNRLRRLIDDDRIDPSQIASGLFCILEIVRAHRGQLIVRTPLAILSLDFKFSPDIASISGGRKELGVQSLAKLPGTHYLLRIPLQSTPRQTSVKIRSEPTPDYLRDIRMLEAFPACDDDWGARLHKAVSLIDQHLRASRVRAGLTVIMPAPESLPTRVLALFIVALKSMNHGLRRVIWLCRGANLTVARAALEGNVMAVRLPFGGPPLLIGDVLANSFLTDGPVGGLLISNSNGTIGGEFGKLSNDVLSALQDAYLQELVRELTIEITKSNVRKSPGPFLIEGMYYTNCFYHIAEALREPNILRKLAEWSLQFISDSTEIVISTSEILVPLVDEINSVLSDLGRSRLLSIHYDRTMGTAGQVAATLPLFDRSAVVISDVICRGIQIKRVISDMGIMDIERVIALVDARAEVDLGSPLSVGYAEDAHIVPVSSLVREAIAPSYHFSTMAQPELFKEERVFVIDEKTHAPTLYVRRITSQLSLSEVLDGPVRESRCLITGHAEFEDKHYSVFLDMPKLLASLRRSLEAWILEQIAYVNAKNIGRHWSIYVYDADDSLMWLRPLLSQVEKGAEPRYLKWKHLQAPDPPSTDSAGNNVLVLVPAIESGEIARRCIELSSRSHPHSILLLCILSRMDPFNLGFISGISSYRKAELHTAFFLDLPISAYGATEGLCPICREIGELRRIRSLADRRQEVSEMLDRRIARKRPVPLIVGRSDETHNLTSRDLLRVKLRALYEVAEVNLEARRLLNKTLDENDSGVQRFLEILGNERYNEQFAIEHLQTRLYKSLGTVYSVLERILRESRPPFPIGRFVGSFLHIAPRLFVYHSVDLLRRFASSRQDTEEICIGLLMAGIEPPDAGDLFSFYRQQGAFGDNSRLLDEVLQVIRDTTSREESVYIASIEALPKLWARLQRSGSFGNNLDMAVSGFEGRAIDADELRRYVSELVKSWRAEISRLVSIVENSPIWRRISSRNIQLGGAVARMDRAMARLAMLENLDFVDDGQADQTSAQMAVIALDLKEAIAEVSSHIYEFFVSLNRCKIWKLGETIKTFDGSELKVTKEVDHDAPLVFCSLEELDLALGQLVENWRKHKTASKFGSEVRIRLFREGELIVLELGDDIDGEFRLESEGGLRIVREVCEGYGIRLKVAGDARQKALQLFFIPIDASRLIGDMPHE